MLTDEKWSDLEQDSTLSDFRTDIFLFWGFVHDRQYFWNRKSLCLRPKGASNVPSTYPRALSSGQVWNCLFIFYNIILFFVWGEGSRKSKCHLNKSFHCNSKKVRENLYEKRPLRIIVCVRRSLISSFNIFVISSWEQKWIKAIPYARGSQPVVRVPLVVRKQVLGGTRNSWNKQIFCLFCIFWGKKVVLVVRNCIKSRIGGTPKKNLFI